MEFDAGTRSSASFDVPTTRWFSKPKALESATAKTAPVAKKEAAAVQQHPHHDT